MSDKVWDNTTIIQTHTGAIGVENTDDTGIEAVRTMIGHRQGFGVAFGLVVDTAWANRIDIAGVVFALGMLERIAIDF